MARRTKRTSFTLKGAAANAFVAQALRASGDAKDAETAQRIDPMALPAGESCATCVHTERCCAIFGATPENTRCDFHPIRFVPRAAPVAGAVSGQGGET